MDEGRTEGTSEQWGPSSALKANNYSSEDDEGGVNNGAENENELFYDANDNGDDDQDDGPD